MIVGITGILEQIGNDWVILRLGGVEIHISVPTSTLSTMGLSATRSDYTHTSMLKKIILLYTDLAVKKNWKCSVFSSVFRGGTTYGIKYAFQHEPL
jgi:Holliday junction resolvasome RuvABC DNA-binding subunit